MDQYLIRWANKVQGVTKVEYLNIQNDAGIESEEPQDFTSGPYTGEVVRNVRLPDLPTVKELPPIPPYSNPFHHDAFNMGCDLSGPWMAIRTILSGNVAILVSFTSLRCAHVWCLYMCRKIGTGVHRSWKTFRIRPTMIRAGVAMVCV